MALTDQETQSAKLLTMWTKINDVDMDNARRHTLIVGEYFAPEILGGMLF